MLDELAKGIGYWVLTGLAIYVIGKMILSRGEAEEAERNRRWSIDDHERRLAYRKIWQSTQDPRIRSSVKFSYGAWALLDLDLSDDAYDRKMAGDTAYAEALRNVKVNGYCLVLHEGKIVQGSEVNQQAA